MKTNSNLEFAEHILSVIKSSLSGHDLLDDLKINDNEDGGPSKLVRDMKLKNEGHE